MTTKEKMEYLKRYRDSVNKRQKKKQELAMLNTWITNISPTLSQTQAGGAVVSKYDIYLEQKEQLELDIEELRKQIKLNEANTRAAINTVQDEDTKRYLSYYYLLFMTWEEAAEIAGYAERYFRDKCKSEVAKLDIKTSPLTS